MSEFNPEFGIRFWVIESLLLAGFSLLVWACLHFSYRLTDYAHLWRPIFMGGG